MKRGKPKSAKEYGTLYERFIKKPVVTKKLKKKENWYVKFCRRAGKSFKAKDEFKKVEFRPEEEAVHKTLSAGVAQVHFPERKIPRPSKEKLFTINYEKIATELADLADKALFRAKKLGKDRVVVSEKTLEPKYTPS